jgi:hypothetical protein
MRTLAVLFRSDNGGDNGKQTTVSPDSLGFLFIDQHEQ